MPIIKSAEKRMRQSEARRKYNVAVKNDVKKQIKIVHSEIATGNVASSEALRLAIAKLDSAVKKGVLHKRTAARRKSRLTLAFNAAAKTPYGTESAGKASVKKTATKKPAAKKAPAKKTAAKTVTKKPTAKK